jgi:hypothetical protein
MSTSTATVTASANVPLRTPPKANRRAHRERLIKEAKRVEFRARQLGIVPKHTKNIIMPTEYMGVTCAIYGVKRFFGAKIVFEGEEFRLGTFENIIDAAKARDFKAIQLYGSEARLNLPRETYEVSGL